MPMTSPIKPGPGGYHYGGRPAWSHGHPDAKHNLMKLVKEISIQGKFVDMDPQDAIFHSFFDIPSFDIVRQYYDRGKPVFRGMYEKNDPHKRLLMIINFNTDVSNYWEFSATGFRPVDESNQAYKLGVNYLMYALTH
jgi:hypothetical protein